MSFKRTMVVLAVFLVVWLVYKLDKNRQEKKQEIKTETERLLKVDAKDVDQMRLVNPEGQFELVKDSEGAAGEGWSLVAPIKTRAEADTVRGLISQLAAGQKKDAFSLSGDKKLADYGLEKPKTSIELTAKGKGKTETIKLGDKGASYGDYYAASSLNEKEVFLVTGALQGSLEKRLYDLRDKNVLTCPPDDSTTMTLTRGGETVLAQKRGEHWALESPIKDVADDTAVAELLRKVDLALAADFVDSTATLNLATFGLKEPKTTLAVWGSDLASTASLLIGNKQAEEDRYYAKRSDDPQVFMIGKDVFDAMQKGVKDLRTHKVFPQFTGSYDVGRVELKSKGATLALAKNDKGEWRAEGREDVLDGVAVDDLTANWTGLEITEFLTDDPSTTETAKYGVGRPELKVTLASADGKRVDILHVGKFDEQKPAIYAWRDGSPSVYELSWTLRSQLVKTADDLTQKKLASFDTSQVSSIHAERMKDGKSQTATFEKNAGRWQGRVDADGAMKSFDPMDAENLLNKAGDLRYQSKYAPGSKDTEFLLAPFDDLETTLTLRRADKSPVFDFVFTKDQFDVRFARQRDGVAYRIDSKDYAPVSEALTRLVDAVKEKEEKEK